MKNKKTIYGIFFLILWIAVIFLFSGSNASESTKQTNTVINYLENLAKNNSFFELILYKLTEKHSLVYSIRKLAHITVFCILQVISFCILKNHGANTTKATIYSMLIVIGYASFDEIHQYFVPGRSCEIKDVLIDTLGGIIGLSICYVVTIAKYLLKNIKKLKAY